MSTTPTINPNPNSDEILALCKDTLGIVVAVQAYLSSPKGLTDSNHDNFFKLQMILVMEVRRWSGNGIQIAGQGAGAAIDSINHTVDLLKKTIAIRKKISHDLSIITAFADLAVSIGTGNPVDIIKNGLALTNLL